VTGLIEALKGIRPSLPAAERWPEEEVDQISVRLKTDHLSVVGRGMPAAEFLRPAPPAPPGQRPLPEWAGTVLEAAATADLPEQALDEALGRLLASRAAKVRAQDLLRQQVDDLKLEDGRTVRERAAKDAAFASDCRLLLESARLAASRAAGGKAWEVRLRLPLRRLAEFARAKATAGTCPPWRAAENAENAE
jgi:hypothetical protein